MVVGVSVWAAQVVPPLVVCLMLPVPPASQPLLASANQAPYQVTLTPGDCAVQAL